MHARHEGCQAIQVGILLSNAFHWLLVNRRLSLKETDAAARWVGFGQGMEEEAAEGEVHQVYACVFGTYRTSVPNLTVVGYPRVLVYCSQ